MASTGTMHLAALRRSRWRSAPPHLWAQLDVVDHIFKAEATSHGVVYHESIVMCNAQRIVMHPNPWPEVSGAAAASSAEAKPDCNGEAINAGVVELVERVAFTGASPHLLCCAAATVSDV